MSYIRTQQKLMKMLAKRPGCIILRVHRGPRFVDGLSGPPRISSQQREYKEDPTRSDLKSCIPSWIEYDL